MSHTEIEPDPREIMMSPMDFTDTGNGMAALIEGVILSNLRATRELFRARNPQTVAEVQRRFVREYMAVLHHGITMVARAVADKPRAPTCPALTVTLSPSGETGA